jgi:hypothetical protein
MALELDDIGANDGGPNFFRLPAGRSAESADTLQSVPRLVIQMSP